MTKLNQEFVLPKRLEDHLEGCHNAIKDVGFEIQAIGALLGGQGDDCSLNSEDWNCLGRLLNRQAKQILRISGEIEPGPFTNMAQGTRPVFHSEK